MVQDEPSHWCHTAFPLPVPSRATCGPPASYGVPSMRTGPAHPVPAMYRFTATLSRMPAFSVEIAIAFPEGATAVSPVDASPPPAFASILTSVPHAPPAYRPAQMLQRPPHSVQTA